MRVYVLLENRLNDDQMVGIRTGGFPTDAARLRKLCDVENIYLADANSTAITYHDFVLGNNMGYTIGNMRALRDAEVWGDWRRRGWLTVPSGR